jgi:Putative Ig domain
MLLAAGALALAAVMVSAVTGAVTPAQAASLSITTTSLPAADANSIYEASLSASGGSGDYLWSISSGSLPPGLGLGNGPLPGSAAIDGVPAAAGVYTFTVEVTDVADPSLTVTQALSITVNQMLAVANAPATITATEGAPVGYTFEASGGTGPYAWSVSPPLPHGLSLSGNGTISGTPTATGTSTFTVELADSGTPPQTVTEQLSIQVNGAACTTTITGTHALALNVTSGVTCLTGATQNGQVTVAPGASLIVTNSKVNGTVTASGAAVVRYCGSTEDGTLDLTGTTGNAGGVTLTGIKLSGVAYVENNAGSAAVTVSGNAVNGSLYCTGNTPPPGDNGSVNTVAGTASGQCQGLALR